MLLGPGFDEGSSDDDSPNASKDFRRLAGLQNDLAPLNQSTLGPEEMDRVLLNRLGQTTGSKCEFCDIS
jgi:hypothetical protein